MILYNNSVCFRFGNTNIDIWIFHSIKLFSWKFTSFMSKTAFK